MSGLSPTARGILVMLFAITVFTLMDALAKHLVLQGYHPLQVVWARSCGQAVILCVVLAPRLPRYLRTGHPRLQLLRAALQICTAFLFFASLGHIGLAEATAIGDLSPVLITAGAALFLGERIGPRRILGVILALLGALIIIRPGSGVFSPAALLPLAAAACYAGFALITRRVGQGEPVWTALLYMAAFGTVATSLCLPWVWRPVGPDHLWGFLLIGVLGTLGQFGLVRAFTLAEASVVAPFGYVGILGATLWGILFFGEHPDGWTLAGAAVIIGAGLYVWHRETAAQTGNGPAVPPAAPALRAALPPQGSGRAP